MKFHKILCLALTLASAGTAVAIPYASNIRVSTLTTGIGGGLTITYILNEPSDSVTVDIMNGVTPVATFAGTTTRGSNTVIWNGTADNAAGAPVGTGSYRVRVTANKTAGAWSEVTSQRSSPPGFGPAGAVYNTVFNGVSPNDLYFPSNTDSDFFGLGFAVNSFQTVKAAAAIVFNADTSVALGNGYATRALIATAIEAGTVANTSLWGACVDPDNADAVYVTGQHGGNNGLYYGNLASSATMTVADPDLVLGANLPRGVIVTKEGANKYAYFCYGNGIISKIAIDTVNNKLTATPAPQVITSFATTTRYARNVDTDTSGNLYFLSKTTGTPAGGNGALFRWNAAQVAGQPIVTLLTEANAVWTVNPSANMLNMMGPAITPSGDVYVAFASGTERGIYFVGNTATATLTKNLTTADRVVDMNSIGTPAATWSPSTINFTIRPDPAGNIWAIDRSTEQFRVFGPNGTTSKQITAPTSQTFAITASNVRDWTLY